MPLNLNDLLKKAEKKGITPQDASPSSNPVLRTWQQESILYVADEKKLEPKLSQTEAKVEPKLGQNLGQTRAKVESRTSIQDVTSTETEAKVEPKVEPKLSQTEAKVEPKLESKLSQTEAKVEPKLSFSSLIGLQRKIALLIHEICQAILEQQTTPLSIEFIAIQCNSPKSAVRKAIQRLEQKRILLRTNFKNGRGGWTKYQLSDHIYQEIRMLKNQKLEPNLGQTWAKLGPNLSQSEAKVRTELESQLRPNPPSSSSFKETTTTEIAEDWKFDITPYARFGFTLTQVRQLASLGVISAINVEQSLIEFAHDLDTNALPPIKTNKINFLMGLFRSGHSYVSEGFKKEQDAMIFEMARRAEAKRKKLLEAKFLAWQDNLSDEERRRVEHELPMPLMVVLRTHGMDHAEIRDWMFSYFTKVIQKGN